MNIVLLVASIFLLCIAQMIKILRWRLFIEVYEEPRNRNLVRALAFGNLVNLFLPFRIFGEIFRVIYSGKEMKNKYSEGIKIRSDKYKTELDGKVLNVTEFMENY